MKKSTAGTAAILEQPPTTGTEMAAEKSKKAGRRPAARKKPMEATTEPETKVESGPVIAANPEAGPGQEKPPEPQTATAKPKRKRPVARLKVVPEPENATGPEASITPETKVESGSVIAAEAAPESKPGADAVMPIQIAEPPMKRMKQEFQQRSQIIREQMRNIQNSFIAVGFQLHWIRENNMYRILDYKNVYEYAEKEYGIKKTTCCNFISIIENYAERDADGNVIESIADCYRNYSASQLVAMLGMSEEMKQQITPDMSVRAINRMRKGEDEKPAAETAKVPASAPVEKPTDKDATVPVEESTDKEAAVPTEEPSDKEAAVQVEESADKEATVPAEEPSDKEVTTPVEGATGKDIAPPQKEPDADTPATDIAETNADETATVISEEPRNTEDSPEQEPPCNPEANAGGTAAGTGTDNVEITEATGSKSDSAEITETQPEEPSEETPDDNPYATGTLMEIDSYTLYQSVADKIDAMMRHVFSANVPMRVKIVCEQG